MMLYMAMRAYLHGFILPPQTNVLRKQMQLQQQEYNAALMQVRTAHQAVSPYNFGLWLHACASSVLAGAITQPRHGSRIRSSTTKS